MKIISRKNYAKIKQLANEEDILGASTMALELGHHLGSGDDREAFLIQPEGCDEPIVLKIDSYFGENGCTGSHDAEQNKNEVEIFLRYKHRYIPKIFDWDRERFRWLEMEYLDNIHSTEIPDDDDIAKFSKLINGDFIEHVKNHHWGKDSLGNPKLLDLGL